MLPLWYWRRSWRPSATGPGPTLPRQGASPPCSTLEALRRSSRATQGASARLATRSAASATPRNWSAWTACPRDRRRRGRFDRVLRRRRPVWRARPGPARSGPCPAQPRVLAPHLRGRRRGDGHSRIRRRMPGTWPRPWPASRWSRRRRHRGGDARGRGLRRPGGQPGGVGRRDPVDPRCRACVRGHASGCSSGCPGGATGGRRHHVDRVQRQRVHPLRPRRRDGLGQEPAATTRPRPRATISSAPSRPLITATRSPVWTPPPPLRRWAWPAVVRASPALPDGVHAEHRRRAPVRVSGGPRARSRRSAGRAVPGGRRSSRCSRCAEIRTIAGDERG